MSLLIKNVLLNSRVQDVLIQDSRFTAVCPDLQVQASQVIDGTGKAIFPSFINAHTHAAMTLLRGYADDLELFTWLQDHIWPFEARLTFEDIYIGARLACLEMIKTGTTMFCDMYWHMPATIKAVEEMGIRAALSSVFIDFSDPKKAKEFRARTRKFFRENKPDERITYILGPHAVYTVSRDSLIWLRDFAADNNLLINIHLAETRKEVEDCIQGHGLRPVEFLESIGFLGPNVISAHTVWVNAQEMDILASRGVKVVHNPVSNMKLASGVFPFREIHKRGICIGLGTDGCSSNNNLDMLEEMKIAALLAKSAGLEGAAVPANVLESDLRQYLEQVYLDPTLFTAAQALECATLNGARIFGLDAGRIAPGKLADCILVDLNHYSLVPGHDLVSNLVYSASSECIDTTICNGQVLMQNRKVPGEEEIIKEARQWEKNIKNRA
ncbi:amidohydrolase [Desulfonatronovibrio hydrogenovorans]|uniref:amidohydrolase n=1 Tax=Desulfonatronovibrio hydrogenovorans TaxID=53245 RepID=UPI00048C4C99|nr:amidohydrolase [Desulfonatronovibrio hydrogenovorans]